MKETWEHHHDNLIKKNHANRQEDIAGIMSEKREEMEWKILILTKLATCYYGTDKQINYTKYLQKEDISMEEDEKNIYWEHLYTLIKYEGKNMLIQIGSGEFTPEIFTRRDIPELNWFSHGPLPLFVVSARAEEEHKEKNPKKFLNEHALLYSPKWWKVEVRTSYKQRETDINYGDSNGIIEYTDVIIILQNAQIHKTFPNEKSFAKFVDKIKELKTYTPEKLRIKINIKEEFFEDNDPVKSFYATVVSCLLYLSDNNQEKMYALVQSFDVHKQAFIKKISFTS